MISQAFNAAFFRPVFNLLVAIIDLVPGHDIGIAIVLLTVVVKLAMWPLQNSALKSQRALSELQPKVDALKKKYPEKSQQEELAKEMMALYSAEKVNPAASCLPLLIQLPVFIALYHALSVGLKSEGFEALYSFIPNPGTLKPSLLGLMDLAAPSYVLAVLAGAAQYWQAKMMVTRQQQPKGTPGSGDEQMLAAMNKQMVYMMPAVTVIIGWKLPGGLSLYWFVMSALTVAQQAWFFRQHDAAKAAAAAKAGTPATTAPAK